MAPGMCWLHASGAWTGGLLSKNDDTVRDVQADSGNSSCLQELRMDTKAGCGTERKVSRGSCGGPVLGWMALSRRALVLSSGQCILGSLIIQDPSFLSIAFGPAASPEQPYHCLLDPLLPLVNLAGNSLGTQLELALCAHRFCGCTGRPKVLSQSQVAELGFEFRQVKFQSGTKLRPSTSQDGHQGWPWTGYFLSPSALCPLLWQPALPTCLKAYKLLG